MAMPASQSLSKASHKQPTFPEPFSVHPRYQWKQQECQCRGTTTSLQTTLSSFPLQSTKQCTPSLHNLLEFSKWKYCDRPKIENRNGRSQYFHLLSLHLKNV
ncbi:unnamed protein product [Nesidiocoris tenuis]|uniref:Uncharacterized protein n=1 Tax=Nesidiocoris tenuis TaxID=355587 RepID=A0A6H5HLD8_9HEMI|nr:unnamed protein product [Nesidiocoris tenuis]